MARCETCGNDYDKAFTLTRGGRTHTFDSFECAIQALAPPCEHCSVRVVGHGVEQQGHIFCCAHCAMAEGWVGLRDRGEFDDDEVRLMRRDGVRRAEPLAWLGLGIGVGILGSVLADPNRGAARRAMIRDKAVSRSRDAADHARRRAVDARQRAQGAVHEATARLREHEVPDHVLAERVRAQIGRPVSHPSALEVRATDGCVELRGPILAHEVDGLLERVRAVRGVKEIVNRLEVHQTPGNIPSLQGTGARQTR